MADQLEHKDFLFEIGTEELPAKEIEQIVDSLATNLTKELNNHSLTYGSLKTYSTPRRLAIFITQLLAKQPDQAMEIRGPSVQAAFDKSGKPTIAAEKFAQNHGVAVSELIHQEGSRGKFLLYRGVRPGGETKELLSQIVATSIANIAFARTMRWGNGLGHFVRPAHWLVLLFGTEVIPMKLFGISSSNQTLGHRAHCPKDLTILDPAQYETILATKGKVIVDVAKRKQMISDQARKALTDETIIIDEELLSENANLTEWPVVLVGSFDKHFLNLPQEVLMTVMKTQQRCFPVVNKAYKLMPRFVVVSNIDATDPKQIIIGNERVIRARLSDAEYFYKVDLQTSLETYQGKLRAAVFQDGLGSLYDKTLRLEKLTGFIAAKIGADIFAAQSAANLSKIDLMSAMVREFPELQGIMGSYYAQTQENKEVGVAIREQYLPRFAGDVLPETEAGYILALADRLDTLVGLFGINKAPTGDKDPLGLRRMAIGVIRIILEKDLRLDLRELLEQAWIEYAGALEHKETIDQVLIFLYERLRSLYVEEGKNMNVFRSVLVCLPTKLQDFVKRFVAVEEFIALPETQDLIEIYKRTRNILIKAGISANNIIFKRELATEAAEKKLVDIIVKEENLVADLYAKQKYFEILTNLVKIKPALDAFFAEVMIMVDDGEIRYNRLALLKRIQRMFLLVADISLLT